MNLAPTVGRPKSTGGGNSSLVIDYVMPTDSSHFTFTGSGSATSAGGNHIHIVGGAQSDRYLAPYVPGNSGANPWVAKCHLKNISGTGGMPALVVLDSSGNGFGVGPYNDGTTYGWQIAGTVYQYSNTDTGLGSTPSLTDLWLMITGVGSKLGSMGVSTDGINWTASHGLQSTGFTVAQIGVVQLFNSANIDVELWEIKVFEGI